MSKLTYKINGFWTQKRTKKISAATREISRKHLPLTKLAIKGTKKKRN